MCALWDSNAPLCGQRTSAHEPSSSHTGPQAFDWGEQLAVFCRHADHVGVLLQDHTVVNRDDVLASLQFIDQDGPRVNAHEAWLRSFLQSCDEW